VAGRLTSSTTGVDGCRGAGPGEADLQAGTQLRFASESFVNLARPKPVTTPCRAIPLVTASAVNDLLRTRSLLANSGAKTKLVTYGRGVVKLPSDSQFSAMEEDSLGILSRIAEILIAL